MPRMLGYLCYLLAIAITVLVIGAKYFSLNVPQVTSVLMSDSTRSLLIALLLSFVARWI